MWTQIYADNQSLIGADPNLIEPGEYLRIGSRPPAAPVRHYLASRDRRAPAGGRVWGVTYGYPYYCGDGDGDGYDIPCWKIGRGPAPARRAPAPAADPPARAASTVAVTVAGAGSFQRCVIARESGGNPAAVNPASGAGGLYQFLPSVWSSLGYPGLPQDASVAMQNAAFARLYAQSGASPWAPSDGC